MTGQRTLTPTEAASRALEIMQAAKDGITWSEASAALAELDGLADVVGELEPYARPIEIARFAMRQQLATAGGGISAMTASAREAENLTPTPDVRARILTLMAEAQAAVARGQLPTAMAGFQEALELGRFLPPGDQLRAALDEAQVMLAPFGSMTTGGPVAVGPTSGPDPLAALRRLAEERGVSLADRALRYAALGTAELGIAEQAPGLMHAAVADLRRAVALSADDDPRAVYYRMTLGFALLRASDCLPEAVKLLEQAQRLAGGEASPYWTAVQLELARAYRQAGRGETARRTALSALRGHAWAALFQTAVVDTNDAVRDGAADAFDVATWCLIDDDPASAAIALDAGRGLTLHAAIETRDLSARLRERGENELADRWDRARDGRDPAAMPLELRREVLAAVAGVPLDGEAPVMSAVNRLLDPPSLDETRAALTTLGADALVYLMPNSAPDRTQAPFGGAAVVVPAADPPGWVPLPKLERSRIKQAAAAIGELARDAGDDTAARAADTLEDVCAWAWDVAIEALLAAVPPRADGRPVRLVLVPVGELALVPWHAAFHDVSTGRRYAIEQAIFSYAPSARMLCDAAWRSPVPMTGAGLFVADPAAADVTPLVGARTEAAAIRTAFYPSARYLGRSGTGESDGAGTKDQVLDWLADPAGGSLLHLACHGVVMPDPSRTETSFLRLAGADRLSAEELVTTLETQPDRALGIVVLAACNTDVSTRGYDEAFSLGSSFLAANARTVVSAQWSVPDAATSVLMFLFHHYLNAGEPAADALWRAQRWMLDPGRYVPGAMPEALRSSVLPEFPIAAWAGFVHSGR